MSSSPEQAPAKSVPSKSDRVVPFWYKNMPWLADLDDNERRSLGVDLSLMLTGRSDSFERYWDAVHSVERDR